MSFLKRLGFDPDFYSLYLSVEDSRLTLGRVIEQQRGLLRIAGEQAGIAGEWWADISGKLYHEAQGAAALPTVGDWVLASLGTLHDRLHILRVLPRRGLLERRAIGKESEAQLLAANIDHIFVVSSLNHDVNESRLERYRMLVEQAGVAATLLLTKADLLDDAEEAERRSRALSSLFPCLVLSALEGSGLEKLRELLQQHKTYVFIGSSGVGKSTLVNRLMGEERQSTAEVRESDSRGRHTTSSRNILELPSGALVIDTPGIRELGLWQLETAAFEAGFEDIAALAEQCQFRDCQHESEPGCAVQAALSEARLDPRRLANLRKLQREQDHLASRTDKRKQGEKREKWKAVTKAARRAKKHSPKN